MLFVWQALKHNETDETVMICRFYTTTNPAPYRSSKRIAQGYSNVNVRMSIALKKMARSPGVQSAQTT